MRLRKAVVCAVLTVAAISPIAIATSADATTHAPGTCVTRNYPAHYHARHWVAEHSYVNSHGHTVHVHRHFVHSYTTRPKTVTTCYH